MKGIFFPVNPSERLPKDVENILSSVKIGRRGLREFFPESITVNYFNPSLSYSIPFTCDRIVCLEVSDPHEYMSQSNFCEEILSNESDKSHLRKEKLFKCSFQNQIPIAVMLLEKTPQAMYAPLCPPLNESNPPNGF